MTEISMSIPLDSDGFLRRECPTCEREFKWLPSDNSDEPEPGGYYCPYCAIQAPVVHWLTQAQVEQAEQAVAREVVDPMMRKFAKGIGGSYKSNVSGTPLPELTETDDMRRVDFDCHPGEPLKVLDDWTDTVHCLICGTPAAT
jgi:endogenous inhibitor of DNA gyrase (YacG/DUF329 family)